MIIIFCLKISSKKTGVPKLFCLETPVSFQCFSFHYFIAFFAVAAFKHINQLIQDFYLRVCQAVCIEIYAVSFFLEQTVCCRIEQSGKFDQYFIGRKTHIIFIERYRRCSHIQFFRQVTLCHLP